MIKKILAEVGPREAAVIAGAALVTTGLALAGAWGFMPAAAGQSAFACAIAAILWFTVLFANAMGAYATAYYLVSSSYNIVPIRISALMSGDVRTKPELGSALAVTLALVLIVIMVIVKPS